MSMAGHPIPLQRQPWNLLHALHPDAEQAPPQHTPSASMQPVADPADGHNSRMPIGIMPFRDAHLMYPDPAWMKYTHAGQHTHAPGGGIHLFDSNTPNGPDSGSYGSSRRCKKPRHEDPRTLLRPFVDLDARQVQSIHCMHQSSPVVYSAVHYLQQILFQKGVRIQYAHGQLSTVVQDALQESFALAGSALLQSFLMYGVAVLRFRPDPIQQQVPCVMDITQLHVQVAWDQYHQPVFRARPADAAATAADGVGDHSPYDRALSFSADHHPVLHQGTAVQPGSATRHPSKDNNTDDEGFLRDVIFLVYEAPDTQGSPQSPCSRLLPAYMSMKRMAIVHEQGHMRHSAPPLFLQKRPPVATATSAGSGNDSKFTQIVQAAQWNDQLRSTAASVTRQPLIPDDLRHIAGPAAPASASASGRSARSSAPLAPGHRPSYAAFGRSAATRPSAPSPTPLPFLSIGGHGRFQEACDADEEKVHSDPVLHRTAMPQHAMDVLLVNDLYQVVQGPPLGQLPDMTQAREAFHQQVALAFDLPIEDLVHVSSRRQSNETIVFERYRRIRASWGRCISHHLNRISMYMYGIHELRFAMVERQNRLRLATRLYQDHQLTVRYMQAQRQSVVSTWTLATLGFTKDRRERLWMQLARVYHLHHQLPPRLQPRSSPDTDCQVPGRPPPEADAPAAALTTTSGSRSPHTSTVLRATMQAARQSCSRSSSEQRTAGDTQSSCVTREHVERPESPTGIAAEATGKVDDQADLDTAAEDRKTDGQSYPKPGTAATDMACHVRSGSEPVCTVAARDTTVLPTDAHKGRGAKRPYPIFERTRSKTPTTNVSKLRKVSEVQHKASEVLVRVVAGRPSQSPMTAAERPSSETNQARLPGCDATMDSKEASSSPAAQHEQVACEDPRAITLDPDYVHAGQTLRRLYRTHMQTFIEERVDSQYRKWLAGTWRPTRTPASDFSMYHYLLQPRSFSHSGATLPLEASEEPSGDGTASRTKERNRAVDNAYKSIIEEPVPAFHPNCVQVYLVAMDTSERCEDQHQPNTN